MTNILLPHPPALPDGVQPTFEEVGVAPTAANCVRPPGSIVRFGTAYYWQVGTLAAPIWAVVGSAPTGIDGFFIDRAIAKTGLNPRRVSVDVQEMLDFAGYAVVGAWTLTVLPVLGGAVRNNSAAVASLTRSNASAGTVKICTVADRFYAAWVFKLGTGAVGAGKSFTLTFNGAAGHGFNVGADNPNISTTKLGAYSFNGAIGAVASTRNIDAAWHYGELWFDGASYLFAIDDETPLALAASLPAGTVQLSHSIQSQPNGVATDFQVAMAMTVVGSDVP